MGCLKTVFPFQTKLEGYLNSGKELSVEQRAAVAKYDAVMATLEFARDLVKQMQQFTKDAEKEQKKHLRKVSAKTKGCGKVFNSHLFGIFLGINCKGSRRNYQDTRSFDYAKYFVLFH